MSEKTEDATAPTSREDAAILLAKAAMTIGYELGLAFPPFATRRPAVKGATKRFISAAKKYIRSQGQKPTDAAVATLARAVGLEWNEEAKS